MSKLLNEISEIIPTALNKYDDTKKFLFKIERRLPDSKAAGVLYARANDWIEAVECAKDWDLKVLCAAFGEEKGRELFESTEYKVYQL